MNLFIPYRTIHRNVQNLSSHQPTIPHLHPHLHHPHHPPPTTTALTHTNKK
ncbi:MAG: hypothetical protein KBT04_04205 [Bacteroidales bacterium]|nr:hypothetical protein [Candidatus Colimorpha onthohippi]